MYIDIFGGIENKIVKDYALEEYIKVGNQSIPEDRQAIDSYIFSLIQQQYKYILNDDILKT